MLNCAARPPCLPACHGPGRQVALAVAVRLSHLGAVSRVVVGSTVRPSGPFPAGLTRGYNIYYMGYSLRAQRGSPTAAQL